MQERNSPSAEYLNDMEAREEASEQEVKALQNMLTGNPGLLAVLERLPVVGSIVRQVLSGTITKREDITVDISEDQIKALQKMVTDVPLVGGVLNGITVVGPLLNGLLGGILGGGKGGSGGALDLTKTLNGLTESLGGVTGSLLPGVLSKREESAEQNEAITVPLVTPLLDKVPVAGPFVNGLLDRLTDGLLGGVLGGAKGNNGNILSGLTNTAGGALGGVTDAVDGATGGLLRRAEVTGSEEEVEVLRKYAQEIPILSSLPVIGALLRSLGL